MLESFDKYFTFIDESNIIYNSYTIKTLIFNNEFTTYPNILENKLYDYDNRYEYIRGFCYNSVSLSVNFNEEYSEDIILHNNCGGGTNGANMLSLLILNDYVIDSIKIRYTMIDKPYTSIHIRNTDYKTDYIAFSTQNNNTILEDNIFLATDSKEALVYFKNLKTNDKLYTFIKTLNNNNYPIHRVNNNNTGNVFIDTICDVILLALADKFVFPPKNYGFTKLAIQLFNNKNILHSFTKNKFVYLSK